ncbi:malonate-semialdehyde dehydrogenase (acetylating)/methylmalonate-semialdehyde dehydrogenase [Sinobacterium caligoides]|uniref:methylmalonate-semialdehyde dehydrogenase (CoA acylating) n=1 Tax=Sinobacterium caligoides TaxID=933926 RepID=A0A3N2DK87_9GAMM|nr:CoA-acylating methylmalonate-semialdehyde dehydrogenase [Sinobacterium caligoides]ROS00099.1 malonate-semialdehyde dehydrogenase (acetylating)/methylmalonate-semialdehyde dehydrogenase [Sinobacterium caligoides]
MTSITGHFINGQHATSSGNNTCDVFNPATAQVTHKVSLATAEDCDKAIASATAAANSWASTTPLNRSRVLFRFKALLEQHSDELAAMITAEHGKVFSDAKGELTRGLEVVEFACGIPHLIKGEHSTDVGRGVDSYSLMQPLGVVAGITPFNFPAMVPMWMFPVAIACGNTFILKPSERDPSVAMRIAELLTEAGLPKGVFTVLNGDKFAVDTLIQHPDVSAISFVGSTPIAQYIYDESAKYGKRAQALGGAKNHMVVMPDADIDGTVNALMGAAYGSAGERCMAISVAVAVGDETADALIEKLTPKVKALRIGNGIGHQQEMEMGPLVSKAHLDKVTGYVDQGVAEGADLIVDGRNIATTDGAEGFFIGGCLFDNVKPGMRIYQEEIFGPVLAVVRVETLEEAIALINSHEYANGTAIFTRDGGAARNYANRIHVGMVGINVPIPVPMAFHSFGGWKRSVFGPLNMHGNDGVRFYTRMKTVTQRWPENLQAEFTMPTMK